MSQGLMRRTMQWRATSSFSFGSAEYGQLQLILVESFFHQLLLFLNGLEQLLNVAIDGGGIW